VTVDVSVDPGSVKSSVTVEAAAVIVVATVDTGAMTETG